MLNRFRCRTGIKDFNSLFVPAERTQPIRLLRVRERRSAAMALETVTPDPEGVATLASMLFLDHVRFQVISELPPNHLRICGLWHSRAGRKSPLRTFGSGRRVSHVEIDRFRGRVTHFGTKQSHS
jgi:hypothetical protein